MLISEALVQKPKTLYYVIYIYRYTKDICIQMFKFIMKHSNSIAKYTDRY